MDISKEDIKKSLGVNEWLEVIKEDKNCFGAYTSLGIYIDILETRINQAIKILGDMPMGKIGQREDVWNGISKSYEILTGKNSKVLRHFDKEEN